MEYREIAQSNCFAPGAQDFFPSFAIFEYCFFEERESIIRYGRQLRLERKREGRRKSLGMKKVYSTTSIRKVNISIYFFCV